MRNAEKANQAAVREITRRLQAEIKEDWTFPPTSLPRSSTTHSALDPPGSGVPLPKNESSTSSAAAQRPDPSDNPAADSQASETPRFPGKYPRLRERFYGTTDESGSDVDAQLTQDMYVFDSPDSVGDEVELKSEERRKRRRRALEREMEENPGLCFFMRRRNAWTGAVPKKELDEQRRKETGLDIRLATSSDSSPAQSPTSVESLSLTSTVIPTSSKVDQENTVIEEAEEEEHVPMQQDNLESAARSSSPTSRPSLSQLGPNFRPPADPDSVTNVMVPVAPPLIPASNPIRVSLSSRSPSELYGKIVRDNRTSAIPINLSDMTRIIVQGWKDEGNWPPRGAAAPEPSIATRRLASTTAATTTIKSDMQPLRVHKSIGFVQRNDHGEHVGLLAHHPHLQRGVDGVRRVLRLSSGGGSEKHHLADEVPKSPKSPKSLGKDDTLDGMFRSHD